jgi:hypothetical protein
MPSAHSLAGQRAFRNPVPDVMPLERREEVMLSVYASSMHENLTAALREFLPDDLWRLLRSLEVAVRGTPRRRDLHGSLREFLDHADQGVGCWRDFRRVRERVLTIAARHGLRGWDPPDKPKYRNSAPLETHHHDAVMATESTLLAYAAQCVSRWLAQRTLFDELDRPKQQVAWRREIVTLLASCDLGCERIATLATSRIWRIHPCPNLKRGELIKLLKADLRSSRRPRPSRSAAIV